MRAMSMDRQITPSDVLDYWFSDETRPKWFEGDEKFDDELRRRFIGAWDEARKGGLDHWTATPEGTLALVILLDQIPRNCHRGVPDAFSTDPLALHWAKWAVEQGLDRGLGAEHRQFLYLPFMHSEQLADQEHGMTLYTALGLPSPLDYMRQHRDIIARFGRFPHRNEILGRESTPEEIEFLKQPGSRF
jgi:uncharacterized protein (DUF924 family)